MSLIPVTVYLGLGSNLWDRESNIRGALALLAPGVSVLGVSSLYETEPWGSTQQPRFLNAVCQGTTALAPLELLALAKDVEKALGREPSFRYGPRVVDVDILFYGDQVIHSDELTIPHPLIPERAFVLVPLAELAPELLHPVLGKTVRQLLGEVPGKGGVEQWERGARA